MCRQCSGSVQDGRALHGSALYTLQYIVSSPIEKLYTFIVTDEVQAEVENVVTDYLAQYVGKQFKSLEILRVIAENENA